MMTATELLDASVYIVDDDFGNLVQRGVDRRFVGCPVADQLDTDARIVHHALELGTQGLAAVADGDAAIQRGLEPLVIQPVDGPDSILQVFARDETPGHPLPNPASSEQVPGGLKFGKVEEEGAQQHQTDQGSGTRPEVQSWPPPRSTMV